MSRSYLSRCIVAFSGFGLCLAVAVRGQIEEVDLPPENYQQIAFDRIPTEELEERFQEAENTFLTSEDPGEAAPIFSELIEALAARRSDNDKERDLLVRSLGYRARNSFNLGSDAAVVEDLTHLISVDPEFEFDANMVSPKLLSRFAILKKERVGYLNLTLTPPDAEVRVEGRRVDADRGLVAVPVGALTLTATRPGYAGIEMPFEVRGGRRLPLDLRLERNSAMLLLVSRPTGATVIVDGQEAGVTSGTLPDDYPLWEGAAEEERPKYSAPLRIGGIQTGLRRIEVSKEGYRSHRFQVKVPELKDFNAGVSVLERTEAILLLRSLPRGATVRLGETAVRPIPVNGTDGRLLLSPGSYLLSITDGASGFFEAKISVEDRQTLELDVKLRPALTLLGILGGDRPAADRLLAALEQRGGDLANWAFLDRSDVGERLASQLGFDPATLRRAATGPRGGQSSEESLAWRKLQQEADRQASGSVYALAVLSDDLIADHADLWFLPRAPAPAWPDRRRISLEKEDSLRGLLEAMDQPFAAQKAWLGASLIDSAAAQGPVVAGLNPDGPAARAGLAVGDEFISLGGQPLESVAAVHQAIEALRQGSSFSVEVANGTGRRTVDIRLGRGPAVIPLDSPELIYAAVSAAVAAEANDADSTTPRWVLDLNQAAVFLHGGAWEDAVRVLRGIRAPQGPGLSQAGVDYWLALALKAIGPEYHGQAKEALERAAAVPGARLLHNDGPLVAPRARARLRDLGSNFD